MRKKYFLKGGIEKYDRLYEILVKNVKSFARYKNR